MGLCDAAAGHGDANELVGAVVYMLPVFKDHLAIQLNRSFALGYDRFLLETGMGDRKRRRFSNRERQFGSPVAVGRC